MTNYKVVYTITERGDRSYWTRVGVAFTNADGSINVRLNALPLNGELHIREPPPDELAKQGRRPVSSFGPPQRHQQSTRYHDGPDDDDIPF